MWIWLFLFVAWVVWLLALPVICLISTILSQREETGYYMTEELHFVINAEKGREVTLRRLPLFAVSAAREYTAGKSCVEAFYHMSDDTVRGFESSGWIFVNEVTDEHEIVKPVFLRVQDDAVVLGSCRADVFFRDGVSLAEAEELANSVGFQLHERYLEIDPDVYDCAAPTPDEALEAALQIAQDPRVEGVEPHFYQRIGVRK